MRTAVGLAAGVPCKWDQVAASHGGDKRHSTGQRDVAPPWLCRPAHHIITCSRASDGGAGDGGRTSGPAAEPEVGGSHVVAHQVRLAAPTIP